MILLEHFENQYCSTGTWSQSPLFPPRPNTPKHTLGGLHHSHEDTAPSPSPSTRLQEDEDLVVRLVVVEEVWTQLVWP